MTVQDVYMVAEVLATLKPSPASATVGENLLWARTVERFCRQLRSVLLRGWSEEVFYERAGHAVAEPLDDAPDEGDEDYDEP